MPSDPKLYGRLLIPMEIRDGLGTTSWTVFEVSCLLLMAHGAINPLLMVFPQSTAL